MTPPRRSPFFEFDVVVVGDLIADHYVYTEPTRLSREAPVMVLRHVSERLGAGGAANVARNVCALGGRVRVLGVVGRDDAGRRLVGLLEQDSIDTSGIRELEGFDTPVKTRVLAAEARRRIQQVLRIDRDPESPVEPRVRAELADLLEYTGGSAAAVIVSDYDYGLAGSEIAAVAAQLCATGITVVMDPHRDVSSFTGLTALTPNVDELACSTNTSRHRLGDTVELAVAAAALLHSADCRYLLVTRGNLGMALFGEGLPGLGSFVEASGTGEVVDVCGAGDTATAVFTLALASGTEPIEAMRIANAASGVVVHQHGAAVCTVDALEAALESTAPTSRTR